MTASSRKRWVLARSITTALLLTTLSLASPVSATASDSYTTKTTLLKNREYADALLKGIREARKEIICAFYLFKMTDARGNLPREIAEELVRARNRGVAVSVILETSSRKDPLNSENSNTARFLTQRGVKVYFDSPRVTSHSKIAVIDSRHVFLGSHNLTQSALKRNNELSVLIESPEMAGAIKKWLDQL